MRMIGKIICGITLSWFASSSAVAEDWLHWRGPEATGVAASAAPVEFTEADVRWSIEIPGRGFSTPIVVGNRLFVTTAIPTGRIEQIEQRPADELRPPRGRRGQGQPGSREAGREEQAFTVLCLDLDSGSELWRHTAATAMPHEGFHRSYGSYASYSPISDGQRLYVSFGSYGLYCYDLDGNQVWAVDPGFRLHTRNQFGEGATPSLHGDRLVHTYDQENQSRIIVYDKNTGDIVWQKERDEPTTWSAPLITEVDGQMQVITSGTNRVRAYTLDSGELLWECAGLGTNPIPNPLRYEDLVIVMSGHRQPNTVAIRLGGSGELTGTDAVVWQAQRGNAYTCQPVLHEGVYYTVTDRGMLSAFDAATGRAHYAEERLPRGSQLKASPIAAGEHLYLATEGGDIHVVKLGPSFDVVASNSIDGAFFVSSPVVVDGTLILRSRDKLYCIGH